MITLSESILWGLAGGVAAELLHWFHLRKELYKGVPEWARSWGYWIVTAVMAGMGPLLVALYESAGSELSPILAFNIGASAPLILTSLVRQVPPIDPGSSD